MTVTSQGRQFDRLATMWLGDIEIFRTSTAQPSPHPGVTWTYMKDVTTYLPLFNLEQTIIFDLGNMVTEKYDGSFSVVVSAHFWNFNQSSPHPQGAQTIYPITAQRSQEKQASAFRFPQEKAEVIIASFPNTANRAILTVAATPQGDEEFWWSHVPQAAVEHFDSDGGNRLPGLSSFREIQVRIDGKIAGLAWPYPIVFSGGIAPPLHRPGVDFQAFDMREYEIDITPWIGVLCDGSEHTVSIEVMAVDESSGKPEFVEAPSHWVLSGKIFIWSDDQDTPIMASPLSGPLVSDLDYHSEIRVLDTGGFEYNQTVSRSYNVSAVIHSMEFGQETIEWTQSFAMQNSGAVSDNGQKQKVKARYMGQGSSRYDMDPAGLWTAFAYPIEATYSYKTPDPATNASFAVSAHLKQGYEVARMGHTPFDTGVEPFLERLGPKVVAGTCVQASRESLAHFLQFGDTFSTGSGATTQRYELWSVADTTYGTPFGYMDFRDPATPLNVDLGDLLYLRNVEYANDTTVEDKETLYSWRIPSRRGKDHGSDGHQVFGLLPLDDVGGTKAFRHGEADAILQA